MNVPDDIWITDTTFRDGQQSREPYTTEQIVRLYEMLHRLGGPKGLIRQCEFFVYTEKDREALLKFANEDEDLEEELAATKILLGVE